MSAKMMQFVSVHAEHARQAGGARAQGRLPRDLRPLHRQNAGRAGLALLAVRRAVLSDPLPAAQQHPRLAADDRRGPAAGGLRAFPGDQLHARDLRPHLPAGPAVRGQLRHRAVGPRHGDIGAVEKYLTDKAWERAGSSRARHVSAASRSGSSARAPRAWPPPSACANWASGHVYDRHDRAGGLLIYGIPGFKLEKTWSSGAPRRLADGGIEFHLDFEVGRDAAWPSCAQRHDSVLDRHRRLQGARPGGPGAGPPGVVAALDYLIASQPQGPGRRRARSSTTAG